MSWVCFIILLLVSVQFIDICKDSNSKTPITEDRTGDNPGSSHPPGTQDTSALAQEEPTGMSSNAQLFFQFTNLLSEPENSSSQDRENTVRLIADRTTGRGKKRLADTALPEPDTVSLKVSNGNSSLLTVVMLT